MRIGPLLLAMAVSATSQASAQTAGTFALGGQLSTKTATGDDANGQVGVSPLWRFGQSKTGWGWHYGLHWFRTHVDRSIGGSDTELGRLKVRPILGGYGYTRVIGRTALTGKVLGGYAFTSMDLAPSAVDAYHDLLGARGVSAHASNTFVVVPEISAWYDVGRKIGVRVATGYIVARPGVTVRSTIGDDKRTIRADMITFNVGMVYSIF